VIVFLDNLAEQLDALPPQLTPDLLDQAGTCLLDALACAYGGQDLPWVRQARAVAGAGDTGECTIWASGGRKAGAADAAFANAVGSHSVLHEDTHAESRVHPGTVVVPAALAIGEWTGSSMVDVLHSIVVGYDAIAQVAATMMTDEFIARGWRASSVFGPFGAAAAAAHLLRLDRINTVHALGLAASFSAGICQWAEDGSTDVFFQNANAARAGLVAALLAREGATGAASAVEGTYGLRQAFGGIRNDVGKPQVRLDRMAVSATFFKAYPSCALTQDAIDAARQLAEHGVGSGAIVGGTIHTSGAAARYPGCDNATTLTAAISRQMSLQYTVAAALTDGTVRPHRYSEPLDPDIAALAQRLRVVVDPVADLAFPDRRMARVELRLAEGRIVSATSRPDTNLAGTAVAEKFHDYSAPALGADVAAVVASVRNPDGCRDVTEFLSLLY
jgi:2-methylcitrate dehydratase PrpD